MGCMKRRETGKCGHFQCPFSGETEHGYECIELSENGAGELECEAGGNCLPECRYSWAVAEAGPPYDAATATGMYDGW